ncbi:MULTISPECIES: DUF6415 family natural product biosynthesis protein [Streptomyces]|uniref:DUF6415 family natural product biosynthesis protein n=1 Tax=Streptomyces TaxID=1883 RepID=UPI00163BF520|nr:MULTISPECIES: DUF6415 family natural product biosynthesis protein [Streptomyces]MBC2879308.1 hypothetical protein [Streptomyces sp. TYQ1024]UBI40092.1 DUF6415 family natural product biosynthesis protein [Streptomyces mobaraensis]UKW32671.1 DUF6415 family natural product biosynthesis protein [Streptomyces sp. TYQ1024]
MSTGAHPRRTTGGFQPLCDMPPWSSPVPVADGDRFLIRQVREHLLGYQAFCDVADAERTFDLLDEVLGAFASPGPHRVKTLTDELSAVLDQLARNTGFFFARHLGHQTQHTVDRARELLETPPPTHPAAAQGHLRRLAGSVAALLELEEEPA